MRLFEEFVAVSVKHPDPATLRGLERRFAERLQIQPSYWSQIKSRSRQIGERLARQFEQLFHKPAGWMDQSHAVEASGAVDPQREATPSAPQDDDERFIVGLVLTYYRRHPQRARTRLLDLLGEVLTPAARGFAGQQAGGHRPWQDRRTACATGPSGRAGFALAARRRWRRRVGRVAPLATGHRPPEAEEQSQALTTGLEACAYSLIFFDKNHMLLINVRLSFAQAGCFNQSVKLLLPTSQPGAARPC